MKVDFNFGATAEITLTPESPREESLVKMCYETNLNPVIVRNGDNKIRIQFTEVQLVQRKTYTSDIEDIRRDLDNQGAIIG